MIIIDQLKEKALFTENGSLLCIERNRDEFADSEMGFTNGEYSGGVEIFPYAIVFRRSSSDTPILMGVYESYDWAKIAFASILHLEKPANDDDTTIGFCD